MSNVLQRIATSCLLLALTACGGGDSTNSNSGSALPGTSPVAGLYVGYYQEDPTNNPEDPTSGAFSMNLPSGDSNFSGSMFFTYLGCQTSNVGVISGTKLGNGLSGNWAGTVDGTLQAGSYSGSYNTASAAYSGTYLNSGGKQFQDLNPCTQYTIAANGTWEMFTVTASVPTTFTPSINLRVATWTVIPAAAQTLIYVLDPVIATSTGNPVVWQTLLNNQTTTIIPNSVALQAGKEYILAIAITNNLSQRIAFGSIRFTP